MEKEHHGFLFGILAAITIAVSGVFIRLAVGLPIETMIFARFAISLIFVLPAIFSGRVTFRFSNLGKHFFRAMFGLLSMYTYFYLVLKMPLVTALTFLNTAPLFLPLIVLIKERLIIPKARFFAMLLGFGGILLILRPSEDSIGWINMVGLACGFFSAFAQLGVRQLARVESTETILSYYFLISMVVSFFPMVYTWKPIERPILWLYLFLIGIFSLIYQYFFTRSLTHAPATKVSSMSYLSVVFSGLLGWWFFHEVPTLWVLAGVVLIMGGGIIALMNKEESRKW